MNRLYRAYCRSCTRASCSPVATGLAIAVVFLAVAGIKADSWARGHMAQIVHAAWIAAAVIMTSGACLLLLLAARIVLAAAGRHTGTLPLPVPEPQARPAPVPAEPAPAGSYTWRIHPAERAEMTADAEALAGDDTGIVVSERGDIYELAGADGEDT